MALWIAEGDKNKKYFHHYASHKKSINTIMEIKDTKGIIAQNSQDKANATINHFQSRFTAPTGCPISEILEVLTLFPCLIIG